MSRQGRLRKLEQAAQRHAEASANQLSLFQQPSPPKKEDDPLRDYLETLDPDQMTPRDALDALYRLRALVMTKPEGTTLNCTSAIGSHP